MAQIHIKRAHNLGLDQARQQVEQVAERLKAELSVDYQWNGNQLSFKRSGANGTIQVAPDCVVCDVKLGMMLSAMKGKIEDAINEKFDRALG